ncbi:MAG: transposase [Bdellovibrionota bacterium]
MSRRKQRDFFENDRVLHPSRLAHGGELALKKRKIIRPLDPRRPVHITMRSTKAKGRLNFRNHQVTVSKVIETAAKRANIKLHKVANVGNHLHLLISFKTRESCQRFMREISGIIARKVTGARKGKPFGKFWDLLAHSRVVTGFRGFRVALDYVFLNQVEGQFGTKARKILKEAKISEREFTIALSGA